MTMQIVGNSHVSVFSRGCVRPDARDEVVEVHWVGALEIEHFFIDHPAARKVRSVFRDEPPWKFLMVGNHDTFQLLRRATRDGLEDAMHHYLGRYRAVFEEFASLGRFGWLVGVQQADNVHFPGLTSEGILRVAREFSTRLAVWCGERGIPVIDPLPAISGPDGRPELRWLQADRLHLKPDAAGLYFDAIEAATGVRLEARHAKGETFEPRSEHESYCSLVLGELALPLHRRAPVDLEPLVLTFARERLVERGLELELGLDEDFVSSGLFDSLDLVEIYTFATRSLDRELDFEISLRNLDTIRKLCAHLRERFSEPENVPLVFDDFVTAMRGAVDEAATIEAESRIQSMSADQLRQLREAIETSGGGASYGLPLYWMALGQFGLGDAAEAARLLEAATDKRRPFAISPMRAEAARRRWAAALERPSALPNARGMNWLTDDTDPLLLRASIRAYVVCYRHSDDVALHVFARHSVSAATALVLDAVTSVGLSAEPFADICVHDLVLTTAQAERADLLFGAGEPERLARATHRPWFREVAAFFRSCSSMPGAPSGDTATSAPRP